MGVPKLERLDMGDYDTPSQRKIARAVEIIHKGGIAAYPTDSVYALGCAVDSKKAIDRIYRLKRMSPKQRLAVMVPDLSSASVLARFPRSAYRLAKRIFPGAYVLIVPGSSELPRITMDKSRRTVGIRIPSHPVTAALVQALGRPMLTTTAQMPDAEAPCLTADDVIEQFGSQIEILLDGVTGSSELTTILEVDPDDDTTINIVREGAGPVDIL